MRPGSPSDVFYGVVESCCLRVIVRDRLIEVLGYCEDRRLDGNLLMSE